ncbi:TIGR04211 family SH3 domain-containing protein [Malonomonas rubra]|uniref:TIGR04211 family SH3 domain-containing protein n=1 Tax=Malonomonas rubra TaxID=57040 RepID=UPI0026EFCCB7|nr:TIGR04211 family SH3 domain-containing protein [Malonomonas rubra]
MKFVFFVLFTTSLFLLGTFSAFAETRYVSDQLVVTVRSNKTSNHEILTTLITGSPVEILEEDPTYVKVKTSKGITGYIEKQYVTKAIPKKIQIAELKKQNEALEQKLKSQQIQYQDAAGLATSSQTTIEELTSELEQTNKKLDNVQKEYANLEQRAENVIALTTERDQLLKENGQMSSELKVLQEENKSFHRSNMIQWFLAGGGVFFGGWLVGKVSRKKRGYGRLD